MSLPEQEPQSTRTPQGEEKRNALACEVYLVRYFAQQIFPETPFDRLNRVQIRRAVDELEEHRARVVDQAFKRLASLYNPFADEDLEFC